MRPVVRWCSGNDPYEIFRITLRLHESLTPAIGTTIEIAESQLPTKKGAQYGLRLNTCFVDGAITEIDQLFRMADSPGGARHLAHMTVIGCGHGITSLKRTYQSGSIDGTCPTPITHLQVFAIPSGDRQPDFHSNLGILRGTRDRPHLTSLRGHSGVGVSKDRRLWDRTLRNDCRRSYGGMRQVEIHQVSTRWSSKCRFY